MSLSGPHRQSPVSLLVGMTPLVFFYFSGGSPWTQQGEQHCLRTATLRDMNSPLFSQHQHFWAMRFLILLLCCLVGPASPNWLLFDLVANNSRLLHNISAHLDLWQVRKDGAMVVASVAATQPELQAFLGHNSGWQIRRTVDVLEAADLTAKAHKGFRTQDDTRSFRDNNEISAALRSLAEEYPALSKVSRFALPPTGHPRAPAPHTSPARLPQVTPCPPPPDRYGLGLPGVPATGKESLRPHP